MPQGPVYTAEELKRKRDALLAQGQAQPPEPTKQDKLDALGVNNADQFIRERVGYNQALDKLQNPLAVDPGIRANTYGLLASPIADRTAAPVAVGDFGAGAAQAQGQQSRDAQGLALALQGGAALGLAPSVAQIQMRQGIDQAARSQLALASSARGGAGAQVLAQRQAQSGLAVQQAQAAGQGAALRAGEMTAARDAFANTATGARTGDLGTLESARNFGLGEAGIQRDVSLGNLDAGLTADELNLRRRQQALGLLQSGEQLTQDAYYRPIEDQLGNYASRIANRPPKSQLAGQIIGGVINAAGSIGAGAVGL